MYCCFLFKNRMIETSKVVNRLFRNARRRYNSGTGIILGIETSCDDTGCAVVDTDGNVLGEALNTQHLIHLNNGGIIPPIARDLHRQNIENVVNEAMQLAGVNFKDLDAVAVTVKPGLPLSLLVGTKYGKYLCRQHGKPFMPIHHMEAHALTARMYDKNIEFPFLVLLISGGHCLLAVAEKVDTFWRLGESIDEAPGEAFDKMARRAKLKNLPEYSRLSGGQAIELAASKADDPLAYDFMIPLTRYRDCNFSFAGIKNKFKRYVEKEEVKNDVGADAVIPDINNLCASFQLVVTRHLCHRVQRGMEYILRKRLIPPDRQTLVLSGGSACNNFIAEGLQMVCDSYGYKMVRPPPKLCTDNGIMIAWNGAERWKSNVGIFQDFEHIDIEKTAPLGKSLIDDVSNERISCEWVKLGKLRYAQNTWNNVLSNML